MPAPLGLGHYYSLHSGHIDMNPSGIIPIILHSVIRYHERATADFGFKYTPDFSLINNHDVNDSKRS